MATIDTLLTEKRVFEPNEFRRRNADSIESISDLARENPVAFWEKAADEIHWFKRWDQVLEWKVPYAKWFVGATTNASFNCLDRHLEKRGDKLALIWEGEDGSVVQWTYRKLYEEVCKLANGLEQELGLKPGDTAAIYMPLVPEAIVAMLACARVGITHSVIFAGFASKAIRDRVNDAECKVIFTADVGYRRGTELDLKKAVSEALPETPCVKNVVVLHRKTRGATVRGEVDWGALCKNQPASHEARPLSSEHPLFFLYTSGTTGKPKGIIHTTGGYLVQTALTTKWIFDIQDSDIYWCTADIGWVTGHSYIVYGPLCNGATCFIYEGALIHPHMGRIWELIDRHKMNILYTAPTAIRSFMRSGDELPAKYSLKSLRLLGTVGEPINPEAWMWYYDKIGHSRCPIVDTWWQTETGAILISPLPGITPLKPGSATRSFPGIVADIVDENGRSCAMGQGGYLVIRHPWPAMLRGIYKDETRFTETYWSRFPGLYFTGDGAHYDKEGYFWIQGRIDDVINVSGHRLGTMEIESALVSHPSVAEAAVVGKPDELKGQAIVAFVTPKMESEHENWAHLQKSLKEHVAKEIGGIARPDQIRFTKTLPKTRSGKIMRRLLKDLAAGKAVTGDTTTLENPGLVEFLDG